MGIYYRGNLIYVAHGRIPFYYGRISCSFRPAQISWTIVLAPSFFMTSLSRGRLDRSGPFAACVGQPFHDRLLMYREEVYIEHFV